MFHGQISCIPNIFLFTCSRYWPTLRENCDLILFWVLFGILALPTIFYTPEIDTLTENRYSVPYLVQFRILAYLTIFYWPVPDTGQL